MSKKNELAAATANNLGFWDVTFASPVGKRSARLNELRYVQYDAGDDGVVGKYYDAATNEEWYLPLPGEVVGFRRIDDAVAVSDWQLVAAATTR